MLHFLNLHQVRPALASVLILALAACGQGDTQPSKPAEQPAETVGHLGTVTYSYDPAVLSAANVQIAIPGREDTLAYGVKLLPSRGVDRETALCPEGQADCAIEELPGLTLALLERPFARYEADLRETRQEPIRSVSVAGSDGIAFDSENGLDVEYRLVPVEGRALLIKLQSDGQSPVESEAIEQVVANIDLDG